jgi:hypothetical protein
MFSLNFIIAFALLAGIALGQDAACSGNEIVTYPIPAGVTTNPSFNVTVKSPDGRWIDLDLYLVTLNLINTTTGGSGIHDSSLAYFDFCGSVEISATFNRGSIDNATIRPDSYGIVPIISGGNNLKFAINKPQNLVIEINGDIFNVVHLLSNTIETDIPAANATDVMYFGLGLHKVTGGLVSVPSNTTVYIAGGGVLNAELTFQNISNSVLRGRGVVYHTSDHSILIENSTNIRIQDVISLNPGHYAIQAGEANGLTISNFRGFSSVGNGDGIDLFCCQNTLIDGVFMRNSDDNIAIYSHVSHKWTYYYSIIVPVNSAY